MFTKIELKFRKFSLLHHVEDTWEDGHHVQGNKRETASSYKSYKAREMWDTKTMSWQPKGLTTQTTNVS